MFQPTKVPCCKYTLRPPLKKNKKGYMEMQLGDGWMWILFTWRSRVRLRVTRDETTAIRIRIAVMWEVEFKKLQFLGLKITFYVNIL